MSLVLHAGDDIGGRTTVKAAGKRAGVGGFVYLRMLAVEVSSNRTVGVAKLTSTGLGTVRAP